MTESKRHTVAIIGLGNVGLTLCKLFSDAYSDDTAFQFIATSNNNQVSRSNFDELSIHIELTELNSALANADLCLLTVKDSEIQNLCESHSSHFKNGGVVAHCSGSLSSEILTSAKRDSGAYLCSLHPLTTFPNPKSAIEALSDIEHGTYLYTEGDQFAVDLCKPLFSKLGFITATINRDAKPFYHAACIFASNYMVSLIDASLSSAEIAGLNPREFAKSIMPLAKATLANIEAVGNEKALSGPIARGDASTVKKHIELLSQFDPSLFEHYVLSGQRALELMQNKKSLDENTLDELNQIFNQAKIDNASKPDG